MVQDRSRRWSALLCVALLCACGGEDPQPGRDTGGGGGEDAARDAGMDVAADAAPDATPDAAPDAMTDAAADASDAPLDAAPDVAPDLGPPPPPDPFAEALALGIDYSCALLVGGEVRCWGRNGDGQLGDGTGAPSVLPVTAQLAEAATSLSASTQVGSPMVCAALESGGAACWGATANGTLGDGSTSSATPVAVTGLPVPAADGAGDPDGVAQVAVGGDHACALLESGKVWCWGLNTDGLLGVGDAAASPTPREVPGLEDAVEVVAGVRFTCARRTGGEVSCWGDAANGRVGSGVDTGTVDAPTDIPQLAGATDLSAGADFACAVVPDGVRCWGSNTSGQLGTGTGELQANAPALVDGLVDPVEVAAGWLHACARQADGEVWCWGGNNLYQLGDGTVSDRPRPVRVRDLEQARALAAGGAHGCAIRASDEEVVCWGRDFDGSLGTPDPRNGRVAPVVFEAPAPDPGGDAGGDAGADVGRDAGGLDAGGDGG
jgi:alpha-tubulin suppressor-like RCC1 family protein